MEITEKNQIETVLF